MKILRVPAYSTPEKMSTSHIEKDLFEAYAEAGFEFEAYAPSPSRGLSKEEYKKYKNIRYEETYGGSVKIHRFPMFREYNNLILKAIRYLLVNIKQYRLAIKAKDISFIYSGSTPPTQGVLCGLIKKKLSKKYGRYVPFIYNLQDIFPDSMITTRITKKGSLIWKIGRKIEDYTYKSADKIIVISNSFKKNIMEKGVPEEKIIVVSNWINTDEVKPVAKEENKLFEEFGIDKNKFIAVYSGNFGAQQGADIVFETAKLLENNTDIQFVIFGGGTGFGDAKAYVAEHKPPNIIINDYLPKERIPEIYSLGDIALVIGRKGGGISCLPSKTWSIMSCDVPVVASFDMDSDLAEILHESGAGICVEAEDAQKLADAIVYAKENPMERKSRAYALENASKKTCVPKYVEALKLMVELSEKSIRGEDK